MDSTPSPVTPRSYRTYLKEKFGTGLWALGMKEPHVVRRTLSEFREKTKARRRLTLSVIVPARPTCPPAISATPSRDARLIVCPQPT